MIGKVLGAIAKPFGEVAGKVVGAWSANKEGERNIVALKIQNKAAELKAASELKIAEFRAKTKRAENRDAQSFTLDELAVKESQGTYWDEFLSFSFLLSFFYWPLFVGPLVISIMTGRSFTRSCQCIYCDESRADCRLVHYNRYTRPLFGNARMV